MENKDRLDEFLQQKFAQDQPAERFVFREEYWLQAQALIEADERRRKRRFFWWWLTGAGLLMLLLAGWWCFAVQPAQGAAFAQSNLSEPNPAASPAAGTGERPGTVPASAGQVLSASQSAEAAPGASVPAATSAAPHARPARAGSGRLSPTRPTSAGATASPAAAPASGSDTEGNTPATRAGEAAQPRNTGTPAALPKGTLPSFPEGPAVLLDTLDAQKNALPGFFRPGAGLERLPSLLRLLTRPLPKIRNIALPRPPVAEIQPHREWRWEAGVLATLSSPSGWLNNEAPGLGAGLSVRLQRRNSPWAGNLDVLLSRKSGRLPDDIIPPGEEKLRYSFGYIREYAQQRVNSFYRLDVPLAAQYKWGAVRAEAGVMAALLLSVWAQEETLRQTSLEPTPVVLNARSVRVGKQYFPGFSISCFAGLEWQASRRLAVGLRGYYQPDWFPSDTDLDLPQAHAFGADLRLRYFFYSPKK